MNSRYIRGLSAQHRVEMILRRRGRDVASSRYGEGYDLLVDGRIRVEVKAATCLTEKSSGWHFNIHRHNKLNEVAVDAYIFCLEDFPGLEQSVYFLRKAPIGKSALWVGLRSFMEGRYVEDARNFERFCRTGKLPKDEKEHTT